MKKFGLLLSLGLIFGVHAALAGDLTVKIDSFTSVDPVHHLGEVCGTITVSADHSKIQNGYIAATVIADPKSGNPGYYNTIASQQGSFCTLILTYTGTASALAWVPASNLNAASEIVQIHGHR